jgi:hypothetical protein
MKTVALLVVLMTWSVAPASTQVTTGRLIGSVVDDGGTPLEGATVTIESPAMIGGRQTSVTGELGEFAFRNLAPGHYSVIAEHAGYSGQEWTRVKVPLGGAASVHVVLERATFTGEIQVVDETPVVDPTQVHSGQVFDQQYLQSTAVGSQNRSYTAVVQQTAGVADGAYVAGMEQPRVFGSTIGENALFVDGTDATDPLTGAAKLTMNFDTIAEIQFQTGGFEAEYGRATGGVLNLVTKSGGNQFSGTFDIRFTDQAFQESGDHFDASTQETSFLQTSFTLGGPLLRDRLWFFAAYQQTRTEFTPTGAGYTRDSLRHDYMAKLTWQIDPSWRMSARYSTDPEDVDNATFSRFVEPEATPHTEGASTVASAEITGVLSDALLWSATLGFYGLDLEVSPQSGDLRTISHYNFATGVSSGNLARQEYGDTARIDFTTDLTWFVDDLAGSHEFKFGFEYSDSDQTVASCATGSPGGERCVKGVNGFSFGDRVLDGQTAPYLMREDEPLYPARYTGALASVFAQDAWQITSALSVKLGLRYDRSEFQNNEGDRVADLGLLQPRIGLAWDLTGDGKTLARASWGRFMDPGILALPTYLSTIRQGTSTWLSCSTIVSTQWGYPIASADECAERAAGWGWSHRLDGEGWDPFGWVSPGNTFADTTAVDPGLQSPYADELLLAVEREVGPRSSIELMFIDKTTHDIYEDTCSGNIPTPSPDAECDVVVVTNLSAVTRDYRGFVVSFETRGLDWLTLLASYTLSRSRGSVEYDQSRGPDFDVYPWHFENRYGYLSDHRRHRIKLNGFITLSGDWSIAFDAYWASPFTWQPVEPAGEIDPNLWGEYFLEPRGSREANRSYQLDLQISKGFTVGGWRLVAIGSVYNVFSSENPRSVCERVTGCDDIGLGQPIQWQTPRIYELGFRVEF